MCGYVLFWTQANKRSIIIKNRKHSDMNIKCYYWSTWSKHIHASTKNNDQHFWLPLKIIAFSFLLLPVSVKAIYICWYFCDHLRNVTNCDHKNIYCIQFPQHRISILGHWLFDIGYLRQFSLSLDNRSRIETGKTRAIK